MPPRGTTRAPEEGRPMTFAEAVWRKYAHSLGYDWTHVCGTYRCWIWWERPAALPGKER